MVWLIVRADTAVPVVWHRSGDFVLFIVPRPLNTLRHKPTSFYLGIASARRCMLTRKCANMDTPSLTSLRDVREIFFWTLGGLSPTL